MVIAKVPTSESVAAPYESCPTSTYSSTSNSTSTPSALQLSLQPRVWHTVLWHIGCQQIGAQFLLSYMSSEGCKKGGGKIGMSGGGGNCSEDYEDDSVVD